MANPRVFIVSGPSGVGKSSIIQAVLARRPDIRLSVSTTTRARRDGEEEGRDYLFVDNATFERRIAEGGFLEWARSYDHYYGTGRSEIERILATGCHALLDIDTQGALQIQQGFQGAVYVFIKPPSLSELEQRLRGRGSETEAHLKKRLGRAEQEIGFSDRYDYVIVNHVVEEAVRTLLDIIDREKELPVKFEKMDSILQEQFDQTARKATRYALQRIDEEALVHTLEDEVKAALRAELEDLIRERLERVLKNDLGRIVEESFRANRGR